MNLLTTEPVTDPFATEERLALRAMATRFVIDRVAEHHATWEDDGRLPRSLHRAAAEVGLLGLGFPEVVGGSGGTLLDVLVRDEAMMEAGASSGLLSALFTLAISCPHVVQQGTAAQVDRWVRPVLAGEAISSLAITEPGAGSDVNHLTTRARRDGDHWVIDGAKTFITSGTRADHLVVAVRTGGAGAAGISLVVVPTDVPGVTVTGPLRKTGWWCSDTAELTFEDVHVPLENLVGEEGSGFAAIGRNFVGERIGLAVQGYSTAQRALDLTVDWCRQRETFGRPLVARQVVRHRLVAMRTRVEAARALTRQVASRAVAGEDVVAEACLAKNLAADCAESVCRDAVQLHGGLGFMVGPEVERLHRDAKVLAIGGGASEVLRDLAANRLGYA